MEMIEVTGNSVESAISKGLAELNAAPADVMIEVLEEPNTGLFGFGAKEARVRMVLIGRRKTAEPEVAIVDETTSEDYPSEPTLKSVSPGRTGRRRRRRQAGSRRIAR